MPHPAPGVMRLKVSYLRVAALVAQKQFHGEVLAAKYYQYESYVSLALTFYNVMMSISASDPYLEFESQTERRGGAEEAIAVFVAVAALAVEAFFLLYLLVAVCQTASLHALGRRAGVIAGFCEALYPAEGACLVALAAAVRAAPALALVGFAAHAVTAAMVHGLLEVHLFVQSQMSPGLMRACHAVRFACAAAVSLSRVFSQHELFIPVGVAMLLLSFVFGVARPLTMELSQIVLSELFPAVLLICTGVLKVTSQRVMVTQSDLFASAAIVALFVLAFYRVHYRITMRRWTIRQTLSKCMTVKMVRDGLKYVDGGLLFFDFLYVSTTLGNVL